jgi:hypothetical protein
MNKQMKQHLEAVVAALVEQDSAGAKAAFHDYLRLKSQSILLGEAAEEEGDDKCKDCDCDPCECDDDKKDEKKDDDKKADDKSDDKKDEKKADEDCEM